MCDGDEPPARVRAVVHACRSDDHCACTTGLVRRRQKRCHYFEGAPAQCSLAQFAAIEDGTLVVTAKCSIRRDMLVEACPFVGPYHGGKSARLQEYELRWRGGASILPFGSCGMVSFVSTAAAANVVLEVEAVTKTVLMIATRAILPGEALRATTAPCNRNPQLLRALQLRNATGEHCAPFEVRRSPLHGRGVFATASLTAGSELRMACGIVLGSLHSYTFAHAPLSRQHGVNVQVVSLGPCSLVNHACDARRANARWSFDGSRQRVWMTRNVSAGDELLWDYGIDYMEREPLCARSGGGRAPARPRGRSSRR